MHEPQFLTSGTVAPVHVLQELAVGTASVVGWRRVVRKS